MEAVDFISLPEDILLNIFEYCDVQSLLTLSLTCKQLYSYMDKDSFWKKKLLLLFKELNSSPKTTCVTGYKSACIRFSVIFNNSSRDIWADCVRCHSIFCSSLCIQDSDEVIIFDFGSKTTWFKYASDSTGQLSMHPTVVPPTSPTHPGLNSGGTVNVGNNIDIYQGCPVCCRMFQNRSLSITSLENGEKADALKTDHVASRRLTSAFSRLAMRHFPSCFDSADITESTVSLTTGLSPSDSGTVGMISDPSSCVLPGSERQSSASDNTAMTDRYTQKSVPLPAADKEHSFQPGTNDSTAVSNMVSTYKFLIMHMLKRNPFFQARYIPFVLCEPTNCSHEMKIQLLQFLFVDIKVPGLCYIPKPVATALYSGLDTCLVIDSGANNTVVSAVVDQMVLNHCVQRKPVGGTYLTRRLRECINIKDPEFKVAEANLDSSQVKRECRIAYCLESESRKTKPSTSIHVKGYRNGGLEYQAVSLGPELYLACEELYLTLDLPSMVKDIIQPLDSATSRKLLSNILLTGGNCRLSGLSLRLTKDLKQLLPEYQSILRVVDPRLMTGRTDAVIGASYIRKWFDAFWITREDFILHGAVSCLDKALSGHVHCV